MKTYTISKIARLFGLSRSTLLYYDRIRLLPPSGRTSSGYRMYTERDLKRLERICRLRQTSLSLEDIRTIISSEDEPGALLLDKRLKEIGEEILDLKAKQRLLSTMLRGMASEGVQPEVNKEMWIEMLQAAGMDQQAMDRWHAEFEHRAPEAHHQFLLSIGIPEKEVESIRQWSRKMKPDAGIDSPEPKRN
jgi:MerR family transcriptional regulator, thiopeptide resistance regulator